MYAYAPLTRYLTIIFLLCACSSARSDDNQAWAALALSGPVNDESRLLLWFDNHARFRDDADSLGVTIVRPGLGWKLNDRVNAWAGYARVISRSNGPDFQEHRAWQQATYSVMNIFGGKIGGRTRTEQRFADGESEKGHRIRQFFRWARPIPDTRFSWMVANETFFSFNDTDWGQTSGYNQNRLYAGVSWQPKKKLRLDINYLYNHLNAARGDNAHNHNVFVALFIRP